MSSQKRIAADAVFSDPTAVLFALPLLILGFIALVSFVRGCFEIAPP
jgi:hypothetical protein